MRDDRGQNRTQNPGPETDNENDSQQGPPSGSKTTILLIGLAFFSLLMCMCLSIFALAAIQ